MMEFTKPLRLKKKQKTQKDIKNSQIPAVFSICAFVGQVKFADVVRRHTARSIMDIAAVGTLGTHSMNKISEVHLNNWKIS